jgi:hypothetical protein
MMDGRVKPGHDGVGASLGSHALLFCLQRSHRIRCYLRMARIAIIALMLLVALPAFAQEAGTSAPAADNAVSAPQAAPLPACGESIGGLRPPFLVPSTPMRSIGYAEFAAKES